MTKSILLIDDERIFTFIAEKLIVGLGVEAKILAAETGEQGLTLIRENFLASGSLPLLILVDFYMSPMDGVTFVKSFYELDIPGKEKTLIALTTSSNVSTDIELAKSAGVHTFLAKPIAEIKLKEILEKASLLSEIL
ncbi:MAG: response regulator [Chryseolinea sp.]